MLDHFQRLLKYTIWANRRVLQALRDQPAAQAEGLPLFAHVLAGEYLWLCRLHDTEPRMTAKPQLTLDEAAALMEENAAAYQAFVAAGGAAGLAKTYTYHNMAGQQCTSTLADILTHVITHGGYHRGQVARAFGRAGGQAVNTDFMVFTREG